MIDDDTFANILPGWAVDLNLVANPIKSKLRELALAKVLYNYGGVVVPNSFICFQNLIDTYNTYTSNNKMFVGELLDRNSTSQQVNFFQLADKLMLVDLPGYGFAKAPKNLVKAWERMSLGYLKNRTNLKRLFLLIDSRHGFKVNDLQFMDQLDKFAVPYQIVLTKLDKTNKEQILKTIEFAKENIIRHAAMFPDIILSSSKAGHGIDDLRNYIYNLMLQ